LAVPTSPRGMLKLYTVRTRAFRRKSEECRASLCEREGDEVFDRD
jgi:hypothetical protein